MSSYRATVYQKSEGSFGLVLLLAAIMRSTKSTRFWMRKNPNLQDPGAKAPGLFRLILKKLQASSSKRQAASGLSLNTIKIYK